MAVSPRRNLVRILLPLMTSILVFAAGVVRGDDFSMSDFDSAGQESLVEVSSVLSVASAEAGKTYPAATVVKIASGWHINSSKPLEDWLIPASLTFDSLSELTASHVSYPNPQTVTLGKDRMSVYDGDIVVRFDVTVSSDAAPGTYTLPVNFTYQPCNDRECRAPRTLPANLEIKVGAEGAQAHPEIFAAGATSDNQPPATTDQVAEQSELAALITKYGFWGYFIALGLAFVTGLLLSFSPCTYPMIPITVSIFGGQQRTVGRGFILSLFYVGSMAVMYGIMGLIVSLVGGVFGAWLANPVVVAVIAVVFVIFALSMFGVFNFNVPMSLRQKLGTTKTGGGVGGAVLLGVVAALVVSPCVGPFVAGILLYVATTGSPAFGFITLFVFALGLGTFYVIIGTFSSAINALPGAGGWMESVKNFFGFVLLLMAVYFLRTILPASIIAVLTGLILLALGIFGGGFDRLSSDSTFFARLKKFVGVIATVIGIYLLLGTVITQGVILPPVAKWLPTTGASVERTDESPIAWESELEAGLTRAQVEHKPVLIDTWATWCANCRVLDEKTFHHPGVAAEAARFVPVRVQLETAGSATTKEFMSRFNMTHYSLPTTLLIDSDGQVRRILTGVVEPDDMIDEMQKIR